MKNKYNYFQVIYHCGLLAEVYWHKYPNFQFFIFLQQGAKTWMLIVIFIITIITNIQQTFWYASREQSLFMHSNPSPFLQAFKAVFDPLLILLLTVTACPLSLLPRSLSLSPVWEGSSAPSASPWIDLSVTRSCSCDTSARWRQTPSGSRRRCHHWGGWSPCWTERGTCRRRSWWLLWRGLFASQGVVQKGQSPVQRCWLKRCPWSLHSSSLAGMPSTMVSSLLSSLTGGRELEQETDTISNPAVAEMFSPASVLSLYCLCTCSEHAPDLPYFPTL